MADVLILHLRIFDNQICIRVLSCIPVPVTKLCQYIQYKQAKCPRSQSSVRRKVTTWFHIYLITYSVNCSGGSKGGREGRTPPPRRPNSFNFMQFWENSAKLCVHAPPPLGGFTPPPLVEILDPSLNCMQNQSQSGTQQHNVGLVSLK